VVNLWILYMKFQADSKHDGGHWDDDQSIHCVFTALERVFKPDNENEEELDIYAAASDIRTQCCRALRSHFVKDSRM